MINRKISSEYHEWYMEFSKNNNTCVITLVMFYENRTTNTTKVYMVLSIFLYYVIDNYVCVDYLCCQSKTISDISGDIYFK